MGEEQDLVTRLVRITRPFRLMMVWLLRSTAVALKVKAAHGMTSVLASLDAGMSAL